MKTITGMREGITIDVNTGVMVTYNGTYIEYTTKIMTEVFRMCKEIFGRWLLYLICVIFKDKDEF